MVTFDYVIDNNRPQARNVRPYRSEGDVAKGGGDKAEEESQASQLFPKGTIVEVAGHPLDEWNGKVGAIQSYDKNGMTFSVDMGKLKLNLKPDYLRFKEKAPNAPEKKEEPKTVSAEDAKPTATATAAAEQKKEETSAAVAASSEAQTTGQAAQAGAAKQAQKQAESQATSKLDKEMHGTMK